MRKIGWVCAVLLLVAAGGPVRADQAADIKQALEAALKDVTGEGKLLTHGAIDVAPDGSSYVVSIPDVRVGPDQTGYLDVGTVGFRVTPDGDDLYKIDEVKLAAEIPHKTADGGSDGGISLPTQQLTAVWSKSLETFLQADVALRDVKVASTTDKVTVGLGEIALKLDSTDKSGGRWDQAESFRLAKLTVDSPDGAFVLGAVDGKTDISGFNVKAMTDFRNQLEEMAANAGSASAGAPAPTPDPKLVDSLRSLGSLFASSTTNVQLSGISFTDPTGKQMFALPQGALSFGAEGFDQPVGRLALSLNHKGLVVEDVEPGMKDFVPQELALNVSLENLPVQELWKGAIDTYASADLTTDEGSSMAYAMFMGLLQQSLVNGKAKINLTDWRIVTGLAQAQLGGVIEASAESMFGAVGQVKLDVIGLDKLIDTVKAQSGPQAPEVAQLEILRGFSTRQTGSDGAVVDHYDINVTPQGQVMINGKEFNFMGPGGGEMPPPEDGTTPPDSSTSGDSSGSN